MGAFKSYEGTAKEFISNKKKSGFFISDHEVKVAEALGERLKDDSASAELLTSKSKELAKAQEKVANSFSAKGVLGKGWDLLKGIGSTMLNVGASMLIGMAVEGAFKIADEIINKQQNIIDKGKEAQQVISDYKDAYDTKKDFTDTNTSDYAKLREGVDAETNENKSLSTDDYERFISLNNQMAEMFPTLVTGYDSQGNALLNLASGAEEASGQIEQLIEQERNLANFKIAENLQDVVNGVYEESNVLSKNLEELYNRRDALENAKSDLDSANAGIEKSVTDSFSKTDSYRDAFDIDDSNLYSDYTKIVDTAAEDADAIYSAIYQAASEVGANVITGQGDGNTLEYSVLKMTDDQAKQFYTSYINNLKAQGTEAASDISGELNDVMSQISVDEREKDALWKSLVPDLLSSMQLYDGYNELSDGIKQLINTAIGNIDYSEIPEEDRNNLRVYLRKLLLDPILDMDDETKDTFDDMLDVYQNDTLTIAEKTAALREKLASASGTGRELIWDSFNALGLTTDGRFDTTNGKLDELLNRDNNILSRDQISDMTDAEFTVYYDLVVDKGKTFKDAEDALNQVQKLVTQKTQTDDTVTFSSLLGLDDDGNQSTFSKNIDDFQEKMSSIQTLLDQLKSGDEVDLTDVIQEFPELAGKTDDLAQSLSNLKLDSLKKFGSTWKNATSTLSGKELETANEAFRNLINSIDLSEIDFKKFSLNDFIGNNFVPTLDRSYIEPILKQVYSEFGSTEDGLEVLARLSLDPDAATWTYEKWKSKIEEELPKIQLRDELKQIETLGNDLSDLQTEASGMQDALNLKDARGVQKVAQDYEGLIQNSKEQITNLRQTNELLTKQQQEFDPLDEGYRNIQSQIDANNASIRSAIQSQIEWNKAASELPVQDSTLFNAYSNAQSSANASDTYNSIVSGKKGADELWEQGWVGKDDFTTYAQLLAQEGDSLYDAVANYEENANRLSKYFTEDTSGLYNFLDDAVAKSTELGKDWVTLGENGEYAFDIDNLSDFAKEMGMTSELAGHFFAALKDMGMDVDLSMIGDNFAKQFSEVEYGSNNAAQQVQNLINQMETLASADIDITGSVDDAAEALKTLDEQGVDVSGMLEQLNELGNMNGFHINDDFSVTLTNLQNAYNTISQYQDLSVNVDANVDGDLDTLVNELLGMGQETLISVGFKPADGETITAEDIKAQIGTVEIPVEYQMNGQESTADATPTVDANTDPFVEKVNTAINDANSKEATMKVDGNNGPFKTSVNEAVAYAAAKNPLINVGATTSNITSSINSALAGPFSISVSAQVSGLPNKLFTGTALAPARASGTAYNMLNLKPAYANGDIALSQNEQALVNELGTESIIRDGRWSLLPGGMHVESLKKGDIVLNHLQTKQLMETGKAFGNGKMYGSALAYGTAHEGISAYAIPQSVKGGTGGNYTKRPGSSSSSSSSSNTTTSSSTPKKSSNKKKSTSDSTSVSDKVSKAVEKISKWVSQHFDWIEIKIDHLTKKADSYYTKAQNAISLGLDGQANYGNAYNNIKNAIKTNQSLISYNQQGAARYQKQANTVKTKYDSKLKGNDKKTFDEAVKTLNAGGKIDISLYSANVKQAISDYKQYYDSAQECKYAVDDLNSTLIEQKQALYNLPIDEATAKIEKLEQALSNLNLAFTKLSAGKNVSIDDQNKNLDKQLANQLNQVQTQQKAVTKLKTELNAAQKAVNTATAAQKSATTSQTKAANTVKSKSSSVLSDRKMNSVLTSSQKTAVKNGTSITLTSKQKRKLTKAQKNKINAYNNSVKEKSSANATLSTAKSNLTTAQSDLKIVQDAYDKQLQTAADAENDYLNQQVENEKQKFENVKTYYENRINLMDKEKSLSEASGAYESSKDYTQQLALTNDELKKMKSQLKSSIDKGIIQVGSAEWLEMQSNIVETETSLKNMQQSVRKLELQEMFERAAEAAQKFIDKLQTVNSLITDNMKFDKDGHLTQNGALSMALDAESLEKSKQNLKDYADERNNILTIRWNEKGYMGDYVRGVDSELDGLLDDVDSNIKSEIGNVQSYMQSLLDTVISSNEKERDSILEVIDAHKDALSKKKEYYDYDKKLKSQNKDMAKVRQQIAGLQGSTDKQDIAQLKKYQAQLKELEDERDDTVKEHLYDMQTDALDQISDDINKYYEEMIDALKRSPVEAAKAIEEFCNKNGISSDDIASKISDVLGQYLDPKGTNKAETDTTIKNSGLQGNDAQTISAEVQKKLDDFSKLVNDLGTDYGTTEMTSKINAATAAYNNLSETEKTYAQADYKKLGDTKDAHDKEVKRIADEAAAKRKQEEEARKAAEAKKNQNNKTTPTTNPQKPQTVSTQGNGKIDVGDKITITSNDAGAWKYSSKSKSKNSLNKMLKKGSTYYVGAYKKDDPFPVHLYSDKERKKSVGWVRTKWLKGYASGTPSVHGDQLAWTNENWEKNGGEIIVRKSDGAILTPLGNGDTIFSADKVQALYKMLETNPLQTDYNMFTPRDLTTQIQTVNNTPVNFTDSHNIIVQGDLTRDTLPDLQTILKKSSDYTQNEIRKDLVKAGRKKTFR